MIKHLYLYRILKKKHTEKQYPRNKIHKYIFYETVHYFSTAMCKRPLIELRRSIPSQGRCRYFQGLCGRTEIAAETVFESTSIGGIPEFLRLRLTSSKTNPSPPLHRKNKCLLHHFHLELITL